LSEESQEGRQTGDEQQSEWEIVRTVGTDLEAELIVGYLRSNAIPAQVESIRFEQEPVNFGDMSQVHVRVPKEHQAIAKRLLDQRDAEGPEDDDAEE
jgi:hypothetical protein